MNYDNFKTYKKWSNLLLNKNVNKILRDVVDNDLIFKFYNKLINSSKMYGII